MELRRYLSVLRARWALIVFMIIVGLLSAYMITPREVKYTATSTLFIGSRVLQVDQGDLTGDRSNAIAYLARTYGIMIDSEPIAAKAAQAAGLARSAKDIVRATQTEPVFATQLLLINVRDKDPEVAQRLANALASVFIDDVQNYDPGAAEGALPTFKAYVFDSARLPTVPDGNNLIFNLAIGTLVGLLSGLVLVLLFDYLDITIRSASDVESRLELPVLGVIPSLGAELPATPALRAVRARSGANR